jgi:hypothetical protein
VVRVSGPAPHLFTRTQVTVSSTGTREVRNPFAGWSRSGRPKEMPHTIRRLSGSPKNSRMNGA